MALHYKKPVMLYANGIGPVSKSKNRRRVQAVVSKADCITLRDADSLQELEQMGVRSDAMTVTADPEMNWTLDGEKETGHETVEVTNLHHAIRLMHRKANA